MCACMQWAPEGAKVRLPCAHMVCNQTPPIGSDPSLMTFREVETLFHEFGHALQHMLTQQEEGLVSGIRGVEWDAVELPSQFMENWCYDKPTLMSFAKHYQTGEAIPDDMFNKLTAARCAVPFGFSLYSPEKSTQTNSAVTAVRLFAVICAVCAAAWQHN